MNINIEQKIKEERAIIEEKIKNLGYESLRVSILQTENENRQEWQARIDYDYIENEYLVYALADRASMKGKKSKYENFEDAEIRFFRILDLTIIANRRYVQEGGTPEYPSPLWDK